MLARLFGPTALFLYDDGRYAPATLGLLDDTLIKDSIERVKKQLEQIPEGKSKALVVAVDWNGLLPTARLGYAARTKNGWEIHGEAFVSKANKGASVRAVKTW